MPSKLKKTKKSKSPEEHSVNDDVIASTDDKENDELTEVQTLEVNEPVSSTEDDRDDHRKEIVIQEESSEDETELNEVSPTKLTVIDDSCGDDEIEILDQTPQRKQLRKNAHKLNKADDLNEEQKELSNGVTDSEKLHGKTKKKSKKKNAKCEVTNNEVKVVDDSITEVIDLTQNAREIKSRITELEESDDSLKRCEKKNEMEHDTDSYRGEDEDNSKKGKKKDIKKAFKNLKSKLSRKKASKNEVQEISILPETETPQECWAATEVNVTSHPSKNSAGSSRGSSANSKISAPIVAVDVEEEDDGIEVIYDAAVQGGQCL